MNKQTFSRSELIAEIWSEFHRLSEGSFFEIYKSHSFILGKQVEFVQSGQTFFRKSHRFNP